VLRPVRDFHLVRATVKGRLANASICSGIA
jgi:hypothetical protein